MGFVRTFTVTIAAVAVGVAVAVAVGVGVKVAVAVGVGVNVAVAVGVGVNVAVAVGVGVNVAVAVGVGVNVAVAVGVGVNVAVAVAVGVGVNVAVAVGVGDSSGVGVGVKVAVAVGVGVNVAVAVGVGVNVAVAVAVGVGVNVAVGVGLGTAAGWSAPIAGGLSARIVVEVVGNTGNGQTSAYARTGREDVQVTGQNISIRIDVLRVNRDAVRVHARSGLPIRERCVVNTTERPNETTDSGSIEIVVIGNGSRSPQQGNRIILSDSGGVTAGVPQNVVLVKACPGSHVADQCEGIAGGSYVGAADVDAVEVQVIGSCDFKNSVEHISRSDRVAIGIQTELHHVVFVGAAARDRQNADQLAGQCSRVNRERMHKVAFDDVCRSAGEGAIKCVNRVAGRSGVVGQPIDRILRNRIHAGAGRC